MWTLRLNNVYNGPFKPSEYTEKDHMTMVPNDQYNAGQKAQVEKIVLRYIDDPAVALNAYRAGEIDATISSPDQGRIHGLFQCPGIPR